MVNDAQRQRMGRQLGAELLCITTLTVEGNNLFVESELVDIESGRIVKMVNQLITSLDDKVLQDNSRRLAPRLLEIPATSVSQGRVRRVAMLEPVGSATPMQKRIIRASVAEALTNSGGYEALTRTDIDRIMNEYNFQKGGMVSDASRARLGRMSDAQLLCILKVETEGTGFHVYGELTELESGIMVQFADQLMRTTPVSNIVNGCRDLAIKLIETEEDKRRKAEEAAAAAASKAEADAAAAKENQELLKDMFTGDNMVWVLGGAFVMGCTHEQGTDCENNEKPTRVVTLSSFFIGKYEVTEAQWKAVMGTVPANL